jgi:hypothetical protein
MLWCWKLKDLQRRVLPALTWLIPGRQGISNSKLSKTRLNRARDPNLFIK